MPDLFPEARNAPLPWRSHCGSIYDASDRLVAITDRGNVELIVRSVNLLPELVAACKAFLEGYIALIDSGDCGNWDPRTEPEVQAVMAVLAKVDSRAV